MKKMMVLAGMVTLFAFVGQSYAYRGISTSKLVDNVAYYVSGGKVSYRMFFLRDPYDASRNVYLYIHGDAADVNELAEAFEKAYENGTWMANYQNYSRNDNSVTPGNNVYVYFRK